MMRTICYQIQEVSDPEARILMIDLMKERKKKGLKDVNVLDFYVSLHLPPEQINRIMETFEEEGLVKESDN